MNPSADMVKALPSVDPFLIYKWERAYAHFFDVNESGEIDWADSHVVHRRVRDIYGADSAQVTLAKTMLKKLWEELMKVADTNKDKKVSKLEWMQIFKGHDPKNADPWYSDQATFMFKLWDVSEDKKLDLAEYTDGLLAYGHKESEAHKAFHTFAVDGKGTQLKDIDFTQFRKLWDDYFYSTDKSKPGNHLFGHLPE